VGSGRFDLDGYTQIVTITVPINLEIQGQNRVFTVKSVKLEICDPGEGCNVVFWSETEWNDELPLNPTDSFREVFGLGEAAFQITINGGTIVTHPTLQEMLNADPPIDPELEPLQVLVPQAVAALLNSVSPIDFNLAPEEMVISFNGAFSDPDNNDPLELAAIFATYNDLECSLLNFSNGLE